MYELQSFGSINVRAMLAADDLFSPECMLSHPPLLHSYVRVRMHDATHVVSSLLQSLLGVLLTGASLRQLEGLGCLPACKACCHVRQRTPPLARQPGPGLCRLEQPGA